MEARQGVLENDADPSSSQPAAVLLAHRRHVLAVEEHLPDIRPPRTRPITAMQATVLPEPDSPTMPSVLPASTEKLAPRTARTTPSGVGKLTSSSPTSRRLMAARRASVTSSRPESFAGTPAGQSDRVAPVTKTADESGRSWAKPPKGTAVHREARVHGTLLVLTRIAPSLVIRRSGCGQRAVTDATHVALGHLGGSLLDERKRPQRAAPLHDSVQASSLKLRCARPATVVGKPAVCFHVTLLKALR